MTPYAEFKSSISGFEEKNRKLVYSCRDLNNKIRTTDRYIDQFLPFRMTKEVSNFFEYLMPAEMSKSIEAFRKEKVKDLYNRIFESADVIEFKDAMERLTTEAGHLAAESMPSLTKDKDGKAIAADSKAKPEVTATPDEEEVDSDNVSEYDEESDSEPEQLEEENVVLKTAPAATPELNKQVSQEGEQSWAGDLRREFVGNIDVEDKNDITVKT